MGVGRCNGGAGKAENAFALYPDKQKADYHLRHTDANKHKIRTSTVSTPSSVGLPAKLKKLSADQATPTGRPKAVQAHNMCTLALRI